MALVRERVSRGLQSAASRALRPVPFSEAAPFGIRSLAKRGTPLEHSSQDIAEAEARSFAALERLPLPLLQAVEDLGFRGLTPVQRAALPRLLAGEDLCLQARTGSGKTVAFVLTLLNHLVTQGGPVQPVQAAQRLPRGALGLVVSPTRELAEQIAGEVRRLARRVPNLRVTTLCGGARFTAQRASLEQGVHVVVGTPGRLNEHLRKNTLRLDALRVLVLDEADRLLSLGFSEQLYAIAESCAKSRQTLLTSATFPKNVAQLGQALLRPGGGAKAMPPVLVVDSAPGGPRSSAGDSAAGGPGSDDDPAPGGPGGGLAGEPEAVAASRFGHCSEPALEQRSLPEGLRLTWHRFDDAAAAGAFLGAWLTKEQPARTLAFCATRQGCDALAAELCAAGWAAIGMHGRRPQPERTQAMRLLASGSISVLVATDVAARGWDLQELDAVVNVGLPNHPDLLQHRVGRVARAGRSGRAASLVASEDEAVASAFLGRRPIYDPWPPSPPNGWRPPLPPMVTLRLSAGRDRKLRPGDLLGALTAPGGLGGESVGTLFVDERHSLVAVSRADADRALRHLRATRVKGRSVKVSLVAPGCPTHGSSTPRGH